MTISQKNDQMLQFFGWSGRFSCVFELLQYFITGLFKRIARLFL